MDRGTEFKNSRFKTDTFTAFVTYEVQIFVIEAIPYWKYWSIKSKIDSLMAEQQPST